MDTFVRVQMDIDVNLELLKNGEIEVVGRLVDASNASLFCRIAEGDNQFNVIYKPIAGERPLWDFPNGHLAHREVAAYLVSENLKLHSVPPTLLREGPYGFGSVQYWVENTEEVGERYLKKDPELRKIALLDAVINNTDRKIGHLLYKDGRVYGCDHGVTFHEDYKLRSVIWQFADEELTQDEIQLLRDFNLDLTEYLTLSEIKALDSRIRTLLDEGRFPLPPTDWPAIPWPPF